MNERITKTRFGSLALAALVGGSLLLPSDLIAHAETGTIPQQTTYVKQELRATWIATVLNIDWPSKLRFIHISTERRIHKIFG